MTHALLAPLRLIRTWWRAITPAGAKKVAFLSLAVFAVLGIYSIQLQREASRVNRQVLYSIERQTSPEARRRQQETIDAIVDVIDCNNQAGLQRVIDVLVERQVLQPGDVRAITEQCERRTAGD